MTRTSAAAARPPFSMFLATIAAAAAMSWGVSPTPPRVTPFQASLWQRVNTAARSSSLSAEPQLLRLLDAADFRSQLRLCCPTLEGKPAADLLSMLKADVLAAELTHNFNANSSGTWEGDVDIDAAASLPYYPNLWTIMYLKLTRFEWQVEEDFAEVSIMGFRPFLGNQTVGKAKPSSFDEAAERPTYTTLNLLHLDGGNPLFGDVSMVVSPSYGHSIALIEPLDTGNWEDSCNLTDGKGQPQACHYPYPVNCSVWDLQQGTFDHFSHVLLDNVRVWDSHKNCTGDVLARYFARLYGTAAGADTALYDLQAKDLGTFMEPNLAGTVRYPDGIKLVVATFTSLFGTENGRKVQSFCKKWGWVLTWALSTNGAERFALDSRVIDPEVFAVATASHNVTISAEAKQGFATLWQDANATRGRRPAPSDWAKMWKSMPAELGLSSGLRGGDCGDIDRCVGVSPASGNCICYAGPA